jgi:hypothetical protein
MDPTIEKLTNQVDRLRKDMRRVLRALDQQHDPEADQTIEEFCRSERISRAKFYELKKLGKAPRVIEISPQVKRISAQARRDWRDALEAESVQTSAA